MKNKIGSGANGAKKNNGFSIKNGSFFSNESKKRQKNNNNDDSDFIESSESDEELVSDSDREVREDAGDDETTKETADETRKRLAIAHLEKLRALAQRQKEDEELSGKESEDEGQRDSLVAQILQQEQLEESGRTRRAIASRVQHPETTDEFRVIVKHRQSVNAVVLSEDDSRGFSASKDGTILHWDVDSRKCEKYCWPSDQLLRSHGARDPQGRATRHSKNVLALAVSSDGRYLASGGTDRHVHLWDTRTREHIQAFPGHRGTVSCLTFRQGSPELFSGSYDRTVKIWNAEDRAYINTLFGHQGEVLSIDCLRKERVLAVGRDRTMQLFKVPEESRLVFRAPASSPECCCFISNDEFLTGSDDGSIEMWNLLRKKPVCIIKNAHALLTANKNIDHEDIERIPNGHIENMNDITERFNSSSAHSWVSSVTICRNSDFAASGAGNGTVRLWAIANESKEVQSLYNLPLVGFVNSLAFAKSGAFLVAGVAQEPRLGRWGRIPAARNGVAVHPVKLS